MPAWMRVVRASRWLAAALSLSGCGGGVFIGFGSDFDDTPPSVTLTTAATGVAGGQSVRFVAAAADDNGVDHVSFFRVEAGGSVLVARDFSPPYEVSVVAPGDGSSALTVFARAVDFDGNVADSAAVSVPIIP